MATQIESSLALIREYIAYNEFDLIWIKSPKNGIAVGSVVGSIGKDGYCTFQLKGKHYTNHKVIWQLVYGEIPYGYVVDHRDRNRSNNSRANLRLATFSQNLQNSKGKGKYLKGARLNKKTGKWYASITEDGRLKYLGSFNTELAAHKAYLAAAKILHGEFFNDCVS